jgi:hypothetical protein
MEWIGYCGRQLYIQSQRVFHNTKNEFNSIEFDSIVKINATSVDTLSGQLLATQSMLYFAPSSSIVLNDSIVKKSLYVISKGLRINGTWKVVNLQTIQALGGTAYRYVTKKNKYSQCAELVSTARIDGIYNTDTLYIINCKAVFYHSDKNVIHDQWDNWCVYYNDTLFDFDCVEYSSNNVEILSSKQ